MNPQDFKALLNELKALNANFSRLNASISSLKDISFDLRGILLFLDKQRLSDEFYGQKQPSLLACGCRTNVCGCDPNLCYPPTLCGTCPALLKTVKKI